MKIIAFCLALFLGLGLSAQIIQVNTNAPNHSVQHLVQNVLLGPGTLVSNITSVGASVPGTNSQFGYFQKNGSIVGLPSGVVMGAGVVKGLEVNNTTGGPSTIQDPDIQQVADSMGASGSQNGLAVIEFDFIATGDSLKFTYIFASQEYTSYTCSSFNDIFGFFLSGPGINGTFTNNAVNLATIPGTNVYVGINSLNSGNSSGGNPQLCLSANPGWPGNVAGLFTPIVNPGGIPFTANDGMYVVNGMSVPLQAKAKIQCGQTYHIKMAIANLSDNGLPSFVFLEQNSFVTPIANFAPAAPIPGQAPDTVFIEGCEYGILELSVPKASNDSIRLFYDLSGTAINGVDYEFLPGYVDFIPGQTKKFIIINPIADSLFEARETVTIALADSGCYGVGDSAIVHFYIDDNPPMFFSGLPDTLFTCEYPFIFSLDATPDTGGIAPYHYEWTFQGNMVSTWENGFGTAYGDDTIKVFVFDNCTEGQRFWKDIYIIKPDTCIPPPEPVIPELTFPNTFTPDGDGINDFFYVKGLSLYPGSRVDVYNRWGTLVFSNGAFDTCDEPAFQGCWDGKSQSGQDLPDGVYFYTLVLPDGRVVQKNVTIFRR
jgi:gliding motility-associated-like protein